MREARGGGGDKVGGERGFPSSQGEPLPQKQWGIVFIHFEVFRKEGLFPRRGNIPDFRHPFTGQPNRDLCRDRANFDEESTIFLFNSHPWMSPAPGEHPDDAKGSKLG